MSAKSMTFWKQWAINNGNNNNSKNNNSKCNKINGHAINGERQRQPPPTPPKQRLSVTLTPTKLNNHKNHHKRNHSASYEDFTASCDDAWSSKIEDCLSTNGYHSLDTNQYNSSDSDSIASSITSLIIKEKEPSKPNSLKPVLNANTCDVEYTNGCTEIANHTQTNGSINGLSESDPKLEKIRKIVFEDEMTDLNQLRSLSWAGLPDQVRPITWKLLLGYVPVVRSKRASTLDRKRAEYQRLVKQYYDSRPENDEIWQHIHIDIPRMQALMFQQSAVKSVFERILYIWSIRHPASSYVQGMNDLLTPFFVTYLSEFIPGNLLSAVDTFDVSTLSEETLLGVEADSFWCFAKLLDSIQDNYTFAQPGIQRLVHLLACVVSRADRPLHEHLERNSVQYLQFAFRWMNNLLIRELPLLCIVRLWDTYLAEGVITASAGSVPVTNIQSMTLNVERQVDSVCEFNCWDRGSGTPFSIAFHLFVCAAFLRFWSKHLLQETDFQGLILLLQNLPTIHWTETEVRLLVADAYRLKYTFSPNHLKV